MLKKRENNYLASEKVAQQEQDKVELDFLIPAFLKRFLNEVGEIFGFVNRFFKTVLLPPYEMNELAKQSFEIGCKTLALVSVTGFIMGLVLTIQARPTLTEFGAESMLPTMISLSIVREIGPVITGLICAGKISSGIGAELGSMKVTEQIDAMEVSGTNPFKYLVVTRVMATTFMIPILVFYTDAIAFFGSFIGINIQGEVSFQLYITEAFSALSFSDILPASIKTFFFGFAIGIVGCYKGYSSNSGTEGVGKAANSAVVIASLLIFVLDLIAVQITDFLW